MISADAEIRRLRSTPKEDMRPYSSRGHHSRTAPSDMDLSQFTDSHEDFSPLILLFTVQPILLECLSGSVSFPSEPAQSALARLIKDPPYRRTSMIIGQHF